MSIAEEWRDLTGFDGVYQVSADGCLRRAIAGAGGTYAGRILASRVDRRGYHRAVLRDLTARQRLVRVHVAVLEAFVGPRPAGCDASHLDGDKSNNCLNNLAWETASENHQRKLLHGTLIHGDKHKCSKLKEPQVIDIRRRVSAGEQKASLAREYNVSRTLVGYIVAGRAWPHMGHAA